MLLMRMQDGVQKKLRQEQAAYWRGRGTTEQIFILRNILEQSAEWQTPLYIGFIDFKKAFDSVRRDKRRIFSGIMEFLTTLLTSYKSFMMEAPVVLLKTDEHQIGFL